LVRVQLWPPSSPTSSTACGKAWPIRRVRDAKTGGSNQPAPTNLNHLGVAQLAARVLWEHQVAGSNPATETIGSSDIEGQGTRAFGCGRSSVAEPWVVIPLASVRLRPATPKCMHLDASRTRAAENRALTPDGQGSSPWRRTTHQTPRGGTGRRTGLRSLSPQGMSVRLGPRGPDSRVRQLSGRAAPSYGEGRWIVPTPDDRRHHQTRDHQFPGGAP
jgi:hypothetical protein